MNASEIKQIARYLIIGGSTYVLYIGLLYGMSDLTGFSDQITFITGFIVANIYNYLAHYYFTFASKRHHMSTLRNFIVVVLAGVLGGMTITELVKLWNRDYGLLAAGAYGLVWPAVSYILLKIKVFARPDDL